MKNTADAIQASGGNPAVINLSTSFGRTVSDSSSSYDAATVAGSRVQAGGSVSIRATGAGADSTLNLIGSSVQSGGDTALIADGAINLLAAQNTVERRSDTRSQSGSIGVGAVLGGADGGNGLYATASGSRSTGQSEGTDQTWTTTQVNAGGNVLLQSGTDTTLRGAVVRGDSITGRINGVLRIESLQDSRTTNSDQSTVGGSLTVSQTSVSGSANYGKSDINSDYTAVTEQSGLFAGDGGFDVTAKQGTYLKGGVIASTDRAITDNKNRFETAFVVQEDIQNRAAYDANGVNLGVGYGADVGKNQSGEAPTGSGKTPGSQTARVGQFSATAPTALHAGDEATSTTRSAISAGRITITDAAQQYEKTGETIDQRLASLNRDTTNAAGTLDPIFDEQKIQNAMEITRTFTQEVGTFVENRAKEAETLERELKQELAQGENTNEERVIQLANDLQDAKDWLPGGTNRLITTAVLAAASGNVTSSATEFVQSTAVNYLQGLAITEVKHFADGLKDQSEPVRLALQAIVGCAGAAAQNQSCGHAAVGAASAVVVNNVLDNLLEQSTGNLTPTQREARENLVTTLIVGAAIANGTADTATLANAATLEQDNNSLKLVASLGKVAYKSLKELHQAGKLTKDNLVSEFKKQGTDELLGIADDLITVFSTDAGALDRLLAVVDLVGGTDLGKGSGKAYAIFEKKVGEIQERAARKADEVGDVPKGRVFTSPDPLVGDLATKIDAAYPGHVVGVNVPIRDAAGRLVTDADILLKNGIVQVKSGGGKGLTSQIQRSEQATGLPTIGYGPDLKPSILRGCTATNCEATVIEVVKP